MKSYAMVCYVIRWNQVFPFSLALHEMSINYSRVPNNRGGGGLEISPKTNNRGGGGLEQLGGRIKNNNFFLVPM